MISSRTHRILWLVNPLFCLCNHGSFWFTTVNRTEALPRLWFTQKNTLLEVLELLIVQPWKYTGFDGHIFACSFRSRDGIQSHPMIPIRSHDTDTVKMFVRMLTVSRFELIICLTLSLETPLFYLKIWHFRKGSNMERKKDQTVKNEPKGKSKKRSYNNLLILVVGQSSFFMVHHA